MKINRRSLKIWRS